MVTSITSETEFDALKYVPIQILLSSFSVFVFERVRSIVYTELMQYYTVFRSNGLSVIHFYADWSEPCQHMNNILADLASDNEFQVVYFMMIFVRIKLVTFFSEYFRT